MLQKKTFDPRNRGMVNPIVQAYLEKQTERSKPLSERQKLINVFLAAGLALNVVVLGIVALNMRSNSEAAASTTAIADNNQALTMAEAMERIQSMDASIQNMRSSVEFHKSSLPRMAL